MLVTSMKSQFKVDLAMLSVCLHLTFSKLVTLLIDSARSRLRNNKIYTPTNPPVIKVNKDILCANALFRLLRLFSLLKSMNLFRRTVSTVRTVKSKVKKS